MSNKGSKVYPGQMVLPDNHGPLAYALPSQSLTMPFQGWIDRYIYTYIKTFIDISEYSVSNSKSIGADKVNTVYVWEEGCWALSLLVETASRNSATKFVIEGEKLLRIGRGSSEGRGKGKEKGIE